MNYNSKNNYNNNNNKIIISKVKESWLDFKREDLKILILLDNKIKYKIEWL